MTIERVKSMLRDMDAFEGLAPVSAGYAYLPVAEAFDWSDVAARPTRDLGERRLLDLDRREGEQDRADRPDVQRAGLTRLQRDA